MTRGPAYSGVESRSAAEVDPAGRDPFPAAPSPVIRPEQLDSGLKTRRILFPMFHNKTEHFGERRGSQCDATVGGAVVEPQLI